MPQGPAGEEYYGLSKLVHNRQVKRFIATHVGLNPEVNAQMKEGALEVDEKGTLSNWIIPGKKVPGMGGAMDLVVGAKKVIVAMEHTAKGAPKILRECRLPYTAVQCVNLIVTEMGVMEVRPEGLLLTEINPEFTVEQVQAATEATLHLSPSLKSMAV